MFFDNLRYGFRMMRKHTGFTIFLLVALAMGTGVNTAIFSVVDSVLIQPLPFRDPERLVWIWSTRTDRAKAFFSIPDFVDLREQSRTMEEVAALANWSGRLTGIEESERLQGIRISTNAFSLLGVRPVFGRIFDSQDGRPESSHVAMLGYKLWKRRFAEDPGVIGRTLILNDEKYSVIGVLPESYTFFGADPESELAIPLVFETDPWKTERGSNFLRAFGRLRPGATPAQAQSDLNTINIHLQKQYPDTNAKKTSPRVLPLQEEIAGNYRPTLLALFGAVTVLLLIACTNLAGLFLSRAVERNHEVAIRTALGASGIQILSQFLTESILISVLGGALGMVLAPWCIPLLNLLGTENLPQAGKLILNIHVLLFTFFVSVVSGIVLGVVAYLQTANSELQEELKGRSKGTAGVKTNRLGKSLVVAQVALSMILITGAILLVKSFNKLLDVNPGFRKENLLLMRLSLPQDRYNSGKNFESYCDQLSLRLQSFPGVNSIAAVSILPLSAMNTRSDFAIEGHPPRDPSEIPAAQNRWASPGYFHTMGIPIVQGREFSNQDTSESPAVVVIDEALARRFFPANNPIGMRLLLMEDGINGARPVEIVGIAGTVKQDRLEEDPVPTFYAPISQITLGAARFFVGRMMLILRTNGQPLAVADAVRREIRSMDPGVAISGVKTMDQFVRATVGTRRFSTTVIGIFAAVALLLAAMGVYGVISYSVGQRRMEIGIRMALGANENLIVQQWMKQGLRLTLIGLAIGFISSVGCTRILSGLLFGVSATDGTTFIAASLLLITVGVLACYFPARKASRVDPAICLRSL